MTENGIEIHRVVAPIRQQVYEGLKEAIVGLRFAAGQRLTERELTEMTGVSRPTIREALQQLAAEGLVVIAPGKGWVIASPTLAEIEDLYAVRARLEGLAGRCFVERATETEVEDLKASFAVVESVLADEQGDVSGMMEAKADFYEVLFRGAHSETVVNLVAGLQARVTAMRALSLSQSGRPTESIEEIRQILGAVKAKDADAAERACLFHVQQASVTVLRAMADQEREVGVRG